jgi:hypothetical protein
MKIRAPWAFERCAQCGRKVVPEESQSPSVGQQAEPPARLFEELLRDISTFRPALYRTAGVLDDGALSLRLDALYRALVEYEDAAEDRIQDRIDMYLETKDDAT